MMTKTKTKDKLADTWLFQANRPKEAVQKVNANPKIQKVTEATTKKDSKELSESKLPGSKDMEPR